MTKLLLSIALLFHISSAQAASECALGNWADSYLYQLDVEGFPLFRLNERIYLSDNRLKSLTPFEKQAIFRYYVDVAAEEPEYNTPPKTQKEAVERLYADGGYISHFSHSNFSGLDFMVIAGYPGDNEFGKVYRLDYAENGNDQIMTKIADIGDGEITNCTYTLEDHNNI